MPVLSSLEVISLLVLLGFAALIVFFLIYQYREMALMVIFFLRPLLELGRLTPWREQFTEWVIGPVGLLISLLMFLVLIFRNKLFDRNNSYLLGFIVVTLFIAVVNGVNFQVWDLMARIISPLVFLVFPQLFINDERQVKRFIMVVALSTAIVIVSILLDFDRTNVNPIFEWDQDQITLSTGELQPRMAAVFGVTTTTAYWLFQFFAVIFILGNLAEGTKRYGWSIVMLILLYGIYVTYCRTAWVACLLLFVVYNILNRRYSLIGIIGVMVFALIVLNPDIITRITDLGSLIGRLEFWFGYMQVMMMKGFQTWLLGLGWADILLGIGAVEVIEGSTGLVENTYLFILAGTGLIPLLLLLGFFGNLAAQALWLVKHGDTRFSRNLGAWGFSLLGCWFLMSMTGEMITYVVINWYYYVFFGMFSALYSIKAQEYSGRISVEDRLLTEGAI